MYIFLLVNKYNILPNLYKYIDFYAFIYVQLHLSDMKQCEISFFFFKLEKNDDRLLENVILLLSLVWHVKTYKRMFFATFCRTS